jgi:hypothetical protein
MTRKTLFFLLAAISVIWTSALPVDAQTKAQGPAPRPAVKCVINDLHVIPNTFKEGSTITKFTVDVTCEHGALKDVNIEVWQQWESGQRDELAGAYNVELKSGKHSYDLLRGAHIKRGGGQFITVLKSGGTGTEISRHVNQVQSVGWQLTK